MGATNQYAVSAASGHDQPPYKRAPLSEWVILALFALFAGALMIYPVLRAFSKLEVSYNEGWNVYNAVAADHHLPLYGQKYGWTTANYPVLSFYVVAWIHRIGLSYLIAGRTLSLASLSSPACWLVSSSGSSLATIDPPCSALFSVWRSSALPPTSTSAPTSPRCLRKSFSCAVSSSTYPAPRDSPAWH